MRLRLPLIRQRKKNTPVSSGESSVQSAPSVSSEQTPPEQRGRLTADQFAIDIPGVEQAASSSTQVAVDPKKIAKQNINVKEIYRGKRSDVFDADKVNREAFDNPQQKDEFYKALEYDYLEYLAHTDENAYEDTKATLAELNAQKATGDLSRGQMQKLADIRMKAAELKNGAIRETVRIVSQTPQFRNFQRRSAILEQDNKRIQDEMNSLDTESPQGITRYNELVDEQNKLVEKQDEIKQSTGYADIEPHLEDAKSKFINPAGVRITNYRDFPELAEQDAKNRENEEKEQAKADAGESDFLDAATETVGRGAVSILQVPKIISDMFGATDYTMVDELYDKIEGVKKAREGAFGESKGENLPTLYKLSRLAGSGAGSIAMFAAGGLAGGASKTGQLAGTIGTSFLTTEADYYQEALAQGMNAKEASREATALATVTSVIEAAVPDVKYFQPSAFRKSVINAVTSGKPFKEALGEAMNALPESTKAYLKSGVKEGGEEVAQQLGEDVTKEGLNAAGSEYETFDPENYKNAFLGGLMAGGGMNILSRPGPKTKNAEQALMDAVENRETIISDLEAVDPIKAKEVGKQLETAGEKLDALKEHSGWEELSDAKKNHALSLVQQISAIEEKQKSVGKVGLEDVRKTEETEKLKKELNKVFGEEYDDGETEKTPKAKTPEPKPAVRESAAEEVVTETAPVEAATENNLSTEQSAQEEPKIEQVEETTGTTGGDNTNNENAIRPSVADEAVPEKEANKKSLLNRAYEGTTPEDVKSAIEKHGLNYEVEKQADAKKSAKAFIDEVGADNAIAAVRNSEVDDGGAAYIWSEVIDKLSNEISTETNPEKLVELQKMEAQLIDEFDRKARSGGRFISALGDIYQNSDFGYKLSVMKSRFKEANGGVLTPDAEARIEEYDRQLKDVKKRLAEAEQREAARMENETVVAIQEEVKRRAPKDKEIRVTLANKIRKAKLTRPNTFSSATPAAIIFDSAIEVVASSIEAGEALAKAIKKGLAHIRESEWWQSLQNEEKTNAERDFSDAMKANQAEVEMTDGKLKIPTEIIRNKVESGITDINELAQSVLDDIKEDFPNVTLREVKDSISGYSKKVSKTRNDLQAEINQMKRVGRLQSQLEDIQKRIPREKNEVKKAKLSAEEKYYKDKIKQELRELEIKVDPELASTENAKERVIKKTKELEDRIKTGDFSKKAQRPVVADTELIRLKAEQQKVRDEYERELHKAELKNRTLRVKLEDAAIEIWGLTRALMATAEMSFVLVQGGIQTLAHPKNAARAMWKAMQHGWSEQKAERWGEFIKSQPWYETMKKSKLALSEYDARLEAREEQFLGGWVNKIWDIAGLPIKLAGDNPYNAWKKVNPFKAVERAGIGYLNTLRVLRFLDGMYMLEKDGKTFENNKEDYKNVADAINTLTGRASLGPAEDSKKMKKILPLLFFSPRNWASQLKTSTPLAFYHFGKMGYKDGSYKPSAAQKIALGDFMKYVTVTGGMLALAAAYYNNDDDESTEVSFDPTDTDFLKVKLGNTRVDSFGGRAQQVTYQARLLFDSIKRSNDKKGKPLGSDAAHPNAGGLTLEMITNKLSPSMSLATDYFNATKDKKGNLKDKFGQPYEISEELKESLYPMYWGTLNELWKEQPETVAGFLSTMAFFGLGVNNYENKKKTKEKQSPK